VASILLTILLEWLDIKFRQTSKVK